jgi:hypothetical protein
MEQQRNRKLKSNKRKTMKIRRMLKQKEVNTQNLPQRPTEATVL